MSSDIKAYFPGHIARSSSSFAIEKRIFLHCSEPDSFSSCVPIHSLLFQAIIDRQRYILIESEQLSMETRRWLFAGGFVMHWTSVSGFATLGSLLTGQSSTVTSAMGLAFAVGYALHKLSFTIDPCWNYAATGDCLERRVILANYFEHDTISTVNGNGESEPTVLRYVGRTPEANIPDLLAVTLLGTLLVFCFRRLF